MIIYIYIFTLHKYTNMNTYLHMYICRCRVLPSFQRLLLPLLLVRTIYWSRHLASFWFGCSFISSHIHECHVTRHSEISPKKIFHVGRNVAHMHYSGAIVRLEEWVMSHILMSRDARMNESWHTCQWVMAHIWMSHGTHMNESWHTYEWVMHTCQWVMTHIWLRHGAHMNESWHTHEWVMAHISCVMSHVRGPSHFF